MDTVCKFVKEINKTNSSLGKQNVLKKFTSEKVLSKVLVYTFDPTKQFNISSKNVVKYQKNKGYDGQTFKIYKDPFKLLDDLNSRLITGNEALKSANEYCKELTEEHKNLFYCILDKNLNIRIGDKAINKIYNRNLIPVFDVMLSKEYDPHFNKLDKDWFISQKLDGVRTLIHVDVKNTKIKVYSRNGKELYNLDKIIENISIDKFKESVFLDGETVYIENGKEDFTKTISIVRSSKSVKENANLYYKAFDIIKESDFFEGKGEVLFSERIKQLNTIFKDNKRIKIVEQIEYTPDNFESMQDEVKEKGYEGLMLKKNIPYKSGRTRNLAKVKSFHDEEFLVKETVNGPFRCISKETGLETTIECMCSVIIDVGGVKCNVGSGFTHEERIDYFKHPDKIVNKNITVKYFQETPDGSLRFPIYKGIRDDGI
jgi:hypothetical protein